MVCKDDRTKVAEILRALDKHKRGLIIEAKTSERIDFYVQGIEYAMQTIMRLR